MMLQSVRERSTSIASLHPEARAVMRVLSAHGFLSADRLSVLVNAGRDRVDAVLMQLRSQGLVVDYQVTPLRPFDSVWRIAPTRIETVADLLLGGDADAGRGWRTLTDVQRDWPWVKTLNDPADGAAAEEIARRKARDADECQRRADAAAVLEARSRETALTRKRDMLALTREIAADIERGEGWALDMERLVAALADLQKMDGVSDDFLAAIRARIDVLGAAA